MPQLTESGFDACARHIHYGVQSVEGYCHTPPVRDTVVNIFGQFMDIRLGNSDNRLIQALTEHWWPTTHTFLFLCAEIGVTPLDFTMLTSLSIGRYPTQVPYDDTWSILSNARQLLPNINFSHIKSGNVSIAHLRTYLTVEANRGDDITIAHPFIIFMMGHLWFQTANDTVPLGYLATVNDLDSAAQYGWGSAIPASLYHGLDTAATTGGAITGFVQLLPYWFYEYCGVGHLIVKEEVKYPAYLHLKAWNRGNRRKTNDQAANLFIIGRFHIDHRTIETITKEPWFDSAVSETKDVLNAKLLSRKRILLQVPNGNCEYYLGDKCWRQVTDEERIPLDPPLSMSPHFSPAALHEMRWPGSLTVSKSAWDAERLQKVEDELAIARRQIDSIDHQLYAHDLQLRRGRDVRVVPLPPRGGAKTRQRGSGPRTRGVVRATGGGILEMILSRYRCFGCF
ncbi:hypothetical protein GIB67_020401 [Kingdonia uniflora]|uniref:Aminotransferase-like plant mobile domain-containing protein n=1 Tax=Kingdonia uniflora TaxID=39325 RepID=A0A7J7NWL3_9MAGN|nr:hypothetical protein GIB67_020401 [Kingdonia uniflora]